MKRMPSPPGGAPPPALTPFQLSRLYARGWIAGRSSDVGADAGDLDAAVAALNPGNTAGERARWLQGFKEGLLGKGG